MGVDVASLGRLLLRHEARVHRDGWDRPPHLCVLYDATEVATDRRYRQLMAANPRLGPATRVGRYAAQPMIAGEVLLATGLPVYEALRNVALNLAYAADQDQPAEMLAHLRQPGVLGMGWIGEGWASSSRDALLRSLHENVQLADMPGSVEVRRLYAVDTTGRVFLVERQRGAKPVLDTNAGGIRGDFTTSLRILIAAITDTVPPPEEFELAYPRLSDLFPQRGSPLREL